MRVQPRWWIGVSIALAYAAWVLAVWLYRDLDYKALAKEANLVLGVVQPLGVAALLLAAFNQWAGWWRITLVDDPHVVRPRLLALLMLFMLGFIGIGLFSADWAALGLQYVMLLGVSMLLVGFCEEMVTRGILLVSLRGSLRSEAWAWFGSSALFGLLHATNAFFGVGALALVQVFLAFCVGTGLYVLRRLSGSLLLPILVHALWDFSTLASTSVDGHAPESMQAVKMALLACTDLLSLGLVIILLKRPK